MPGDRYHEAGRRGPGHDKKPEPVRPGPRPQPRPASCPLPRPVLSGCMPDFIVSNGYLYLFLLSFLAATIIPAGSEWLLAALLLQSLDPSRLLATATLGNTLGACTTYYIGRYGGGFLSARVLRIDENSLKKAAARYRKFGSWSLLFSWVPIIGDPLCLAGGVFKTGIFTFVILVFAGKLARYGFIAWVTLKAAG